MIPSNTINNNNDIAWGCCYYYDIADSSEFPNKIKPMLATVIDQPSDNKDWIFEFKWKIKERKILLLTGTLANIIFDRYTTTGYIREVVYSSTSAKVKNISVFL
jgi:hypothetical protein